MDLAEVLAQVVSSLELPGPPAELPTDLARAIARFADLDWLCLPDSAGEWMEIRGGGSSLHRAAARPARCIDFGLARSLPAARLVRLGTNAIGRSPRSMASGLREILVYLDPQSPGMPAVLGLSKPLAVDAAHLETLLRAWFAIDALSERLREDEEDRRWSRIGRRTACIAHDLRHSLTLVGLELDRCAAQAPPGSALIESVERARADLRSAGELCRRSLGKGEPTTTGERVNLLAFLSDVGRKASGISGVGDRTRVEVRCAEDVEVWTDAVMLGRLLQNLVLNALAASPEGSAVSIEAASVRNGDVSIAVLDSGRGMERKELANLLRFGRSGSSGSGIGSASAEACARALGADLEFRSRLGQGTEVRFRIRSFERTG